MPIGRKFGSNFGPEFGPKFRLKFEATVRTATRLFVLAFAALASAPLVAAQVSPAGLIPASASETTAKERLAGSIDGSVVDESGAAVAGARVKLAYKDQSQTEETVAGSDGQFFFPNVAPGAFRLTVTAPGFEPQTVSGVLHAEEVQSFPPISLMVENAHTEVDVGLTQVEVAEEQMKVEEKQRILGVVPNFYVSYVPDAAPMTTKQKYKLAVRTLVDPVTFGIAGAVAGIEQGQNHFIQYGQGLQGYAKRYGASYADAATDTMIAGAVFPSIMKQDPRYFYKGKGSKTSRFFYALAASVICKGDNKRWQPNYSNILGALASGGISNLYYPREDRNGFGLTFANAGIAIGGTAIENVMQEFIVRWFTPRAPKTTP